MVTRVNEQERGVARMKRNVIIVVAAVILIAAAIITNIGKNGDSPVNSDQQTATGNGNSDGVIMEAAPKVGFLAPEFKLKTHDESTYNFARSELDKPAVINFWASWCGPCKNEAPALQEMYEKYGDRIEFVTVNVTSLEFFGKEEVDLFIDKYGWTMPVLMDEKGEVYQLYRGIGIPITILVDRDGVVTYIYNGEFTPDDLDKRLAKLA